MKSKKAAKRRKSVLLRVAIVAFAVYVVVSMVQLQLQLSNAQERLDKLNEQTAAQMESNEVLQEQIDNSDAYKEQQARKQGMARPGETILVEIPND
ncbi:MAG: septum formation initiator family protein [Clostridia bacterium]|nr:septum formation initiator family protein [Clostridia bacterium]